MVLFLCYISSYKISCGITLVLKLRGSCLLLARQVVKIRMNLSRAVSSQYPGSWETTMHLTSGSTWVGREIFLVAVEALWKDLAVRHVSSVKPKLQLSAQVCFFPHVSYCFHICIFHVFVWRQKKRGSFVNTLSSFCLGQVFSLFAFP